jgi:hypothetical protein
LNQAQQYGKITGILGYLLPAFLSFFLQPFKLGYNQSQKLHNYERVYERDNSQSKQSSVLQRAARYHIQHLHKIVLGGLRECGGVNTGYGDKTPYPVNEYDYKGKKHFFPYVGRQKSIL